MQYKFLLDLATQYQTVTSLALKAHYEGSDLFDASPRLKLATAIVSRNATFSDDVWQRGHTMAFHKEKDAKENSQPSTFSSPSPFGNKIQPTFGNTAPKSTNTPAKVPRTETSEGSLHDRRSVRYEKNHTELEDIMHDDDLIPLPKPAGMKQWLETVYKSSRGFELGTFDASLLPIIWKKQSAKWEALAFGYVDDIVSIVHSFTVELLAKICVDPRARQGLHSVLLDQLTDRYKKSIEHTRFLLTVERCGTPMTMNHYFADNLEKR